MPPDNTDQEKLQSIAALPVFTREGVGHEYLMWQTKTVSERGCLLESQHFPPPILIAVILFVPFSAKKFSLEQSNTVVTFPTRLLVPILGGPVSLL